VAARRLTSFPGVETTLLPGGQIVLIRPLRIDDIGQVRTIECLAFDDPWPGEWFEQAIASGDICWVAEADGHLAGYLVAMRERVQVHLANLAIAELWRRRGLGRLLVERLIAYARVSGAIRIRLEVRRSNNPARALYRKLQFRTGRILPGYYRGQEDALVLMLTLTPKSETDKPYGLV